MTSDGPVDAYYSGDISDRLNEDFDKVLKEHERLQLLKTLRRKGLCTRDVLSFVVNQANSRRVLKELDHSTSRSAMRIKIRDSKESLHQKKLQRSKSIKLYQEMVGGKGYKVRRTIKAIKSRHERMRSKKQSVYEKKIKHLQMQVEELKAKYKHNDTDFKSTVVPDRLKDFADIYIFKTPKDLPKKEKLKGPFICHRDIKLSKGEWQLLSRDPKFSTMEECDQMTFQSELEKGLCKHRYNENLNLKRNNKKKVTITCEGTSNFEGVNVKTDVKTDLLHDIWEQEEHRYPYNPFTCELDFSKRRPTDYKLNTRVSLPKPLDADGEFQCEIRRRAYQQVYDEFKATSTTTTKNPTQEALDSHGPTRGGQTDITGGKGHIEKKKKIINITADERRGLDELKRKIDAGEIIVVPTDKSSRFAVMKQEQYLASGKVHTDKDTQCDWSSVKYLKNQVNNHMWWLLHIWSYSKKTDTDRMLKNITVSGLDLPEMGLLIKDHKSWSLDSDSPPPSRPVMSGNCTINTHLSELLSEIIEPIALEYNGSEVQSSEEVLSLFDDFNKNLRNNGAMTTFNCLEKFQVLPRDTETDLQRGNTHSAMNSDLTDIFHKTFSDLDQVDNDGMRPSNISNKSDSNELRPCDISNKSDDEAHDISKNGCGLTGDDLVNSGDQQNINMDEEAELALETLISLGLDRMREDENKRQDVGGKAKEFKSRITDFFKTSCGRREETENDNTWLGKVEKSSKEKFNNMKNTLNDRIINGVEAGRHWDKSQKIKIQELKGSPPKNFQDMNGRPILFGCDVVGLYPNLDPTSVAVITAKAVRDTRKVKFKSVNYYFLIIYLMLTMGRSNMEKAGLGDCVARKKQNNKNESKSLAALNNRDMDQWDFTGIVLTDEKKRSLVACMVQIMVLLMCSTTCYKFGGRIFIQKSGLGIGLRGSAAIARVVMCTWDRVWGELQLNLGLIVQIFCRYVDDIRLYLRPLLPGWRWSSKGWTRDLEGDVRTPYNRTVEELNKCLNDVWSFLRFTTEGEGDFTDNFLPTLDFATHVMDDGYIKYKFYNKPMSSNLVLQNGTALSKGCIFSSLRQELVRRMYNTDEEMGSQHRVELVNDFIQLLVNSGHKFVYIKSIILQGLTKFVYMVSRAKLPPTDKRYMPLHRARSFNSDERKLMKYVNRATWYSQIDVKDRFRNTWKQWIKRKGNMKHRKGKNNGKEKDYRGKNMPQNITTAIFIPKTQGGKLIDAIQKKEDDFLKKQLPWHVKLVEKPGTPLSILLMKKFKMLQGCYRGENCICKGKATQCMTKGVVYKATCMACGPGATYIGETARQLGVRAKEHMDNLRLFKINSFMIDHWMSDHPLDTTPPQFKFSVVGKHSDALGRQVKEAVVIRKCGQLNKRKEYVINELIRMEPKLYTWDEEQFIKKEKGGEQHKEQCLKNFVTVMSNIVNKSPDTNQIVTILDNGNNFSRFKQSKSKEGPCTRRSEEEENKPKRRKMQASTPLQYREEKLEEPLTSPINASADMDDYSSSGQDTSNEVDATGKTNVSNETSKLVVDNDKEPETLIQVLAQQAVTVDCFSEAKSNYTRRKLLTQKGTEEALLDDLDWGETVKFLKNDGDSMSFELEDLLLDQEDMGLKRLFDSRVNYDMWLEDLCIDKLFVEDYFQENEVDGAALNQLIEGKKRNKIWDIFRMEKLNGNLIGSPKRKRSPQEQKTVKTRRMSVTNDASPTLKKRISGARQRTFSVPASASHRTFSVPASKAGKKFVGDRVPRSPALPDPKQPALTNWVVKGKTSN